MENWLVLAVGGVFSGILAGILGIGGGFIIVSLMVALSYPPIQAVATSSLVIIILLGVFTTGAWATSTCSE